MRKLRKLALLCVSWYLMMSLFFNIAFYMTGATVYARTQRNGLLLIEFTKHDMCIYSPFSNDPNDYLYTLCYSHDSISEWHGSFGY